MSIDFRFKFDAEPVNFHRLVKPEVSVEEPFAAIATTPVRPSEARIISRISYPSTPVLQLFGFFLHDRDSGEFAFADLGNHNRAPGQPEALVGDLLTVQLDRTLLDHAETLRGTRG